MPEFRFSMVVDGIDRVQYVEIPESELRSPYLMHEPSKVAYRENAIIKHLEKWALSKIQLTQWEVNTDESKSSIQHHTDEQQEEKEADKG